MAERRHCLRHLPAQLRRAKGTLVGIEQMPNGRCRLHGGMSPGAPKGNQNAFKHGRYTLDEILYSPAVRQRMPSIDLDTINFETGSAEILPDQAAKLQVIADGLNRAIERNPREVFLIEGHTDAVGSDEDNLCLLYTSPSPRDRQKSRMPSSA